MSLRAPTRRGRPAKESTCAVGRRLELLRLKAGVFSVAEWARLLGLSADSYRACRGGRRLMRADLVLAEAERIAKGKA